MVKNRFEVLQKEKKLTALIVLLMSSYNEPDSNRSSRNVAIQVEITSPV